MTDRWPTKQYPRQKATRGVASVRVGKASVKVAFEDDPENIYDIPLDKVNGVVKNGKWAVSMSGKKDRIFGISPISGMFQMRFKEFAHAQGQIPAPQHYTSTFQNDDGSSGVSEYDAFTALLEITDGPAAGMVVGHFLRYHFSEQDGIVAFTKPKSKYTKQLGDFMAEAGAFDKGEMKFSENILPALQSRLQAANYPLAVILKDGRVDSLTRVGVPTGLDEEALEQAENLGADITEKPKRRAKPKKSNAELLDEVGFPPK